ncbi:uncharacterized protein LOC143910595 [Arctopsyche grandis]|uniref:uncharacterized protein LOC143910595 n=1 Tax=Arctopsyche grandis TaxID=121162 RepID=UPI00406D6940
MYYSDPGERKIRKRSRKKSEKQTYISDANKSQGYYSEPDGKYFEIDYEFLKQLSKLAQININYRHKAKKSNQKTETRNYDMDKDDYAIYEKLVDVGSKEYERPKDSKRKTKTLPRNYGNRAHCQACCSLCAASDTNKGSYSRCVCRSSSLTPTQSSYESRSRSVTVRRGSVHSVKSVSFLDDKEPLKSPTNYTGKSFTNDLKQFLLGPTSSRFNFKEKFLTGFRASCEDKEKLRHRRSPSIGLIKGLWKSL